MPSLINENQPIVISHHKSSKISEHRSEHHSKPEDTLLQLIQKYDLQIFNLTEEEKTRAKNYFSGLKFTAKIPVKMKANEHIKPKDGECCICYDTYMANENISQCVHCKQQLHSKCLHDWHIQSIQNDCTIKCPYCRGVWQHGETIKLVATDL